jgi:ABC-type spermidine/putrescine transport system permease subunit I
VRALNWPLGSIMSLAMLLVALLMMAIFVRVVRVSDLVEA